MKKVKLAFFFIVFFFLSSSLHDIRMLEGQEDWVHALDDAELKVVSAYKAIQIAEKNGAHVTGLVNTLGEAITLLNEAKIVYKSGNISTAISRVEECSAISLSIEHEAERLASISSDNARVELTMTIMSTAVAISIIFVVLYLTWKTSEKRYMRKIIEARPEVSQNESS